MSDRSFDVICVGRAAVDLYADQIGARLEDVQSFAKYLGGSPCNTAVGVARLGLRPAMLTRVGDEHNGRFVRETLQAEGVDVSQVKTDPQRLQGVRAAARDVDLFLGADDEVAQRQDRLQVRADVIRGDEALLAQPQAGQPPEHRPVVDVEDHARASRAGRVHCHQAGGMRIGP